MNDAPIVGNINDIAIDEYSVTHPISFTLVDIDADALTVSVYSSDNSIVAFDSKTITFCNNQACVNENIICLDANSFSHYLTLTIFPAKDGVASITVTAFDGELTGSTAFKLTVNNVNQPP
ncbi:MAG: hypothetical protein OMM_14980, partial [Candidatus Magnetoglobus multicellularis str. Araruama]